MNAVSYPSPTYATGPANYPSYPPGYPPKMPQMQPAQNVVYGSPVMQHTQSVQHTYTTQMPPQQPQVVMMSPVMMPQSPMYVSAPSPMVMSSSPMMGMMPDSPCPCRCPNCGKQIVTRVSSKSGSRTWLWVLILAFCIPPCCFIPFFVPSCMDQDHFCPQCNTLVGTRSN